MSISHTEPAIGSVLAELGLSGCMQWDAVIADDPTDVQFLRRLGWQAMLPDALLPDELPRGDWLLLGGAAQRRARDVRRRGATPWYSWLPIGVESLFDYVSTADLLDRDRGGPGLDGVQQLALVDALLSAARLFDVGAELLQAGRLKVEVQR